MKLFCAAMEKGSNHDKRASKLAFCLQVGRVGKKCKAELKLVAWCA